MTRKHPMPFGAECLEDGSVRFRLWAPQAKKVELCLPSRRGGLIPLAPLPEGWFQLLSGEASAGSRYKFRIDQKVEVPDPASRFQPSDIHGPSEIVDPAKFDWRDQGWQGRPWSEAVIYELHVGAFSPEGDFAGVEKRLDYLADLGVTAVELMPLADFPGARNWGYDGVLPYAPDGSYGRPEALKTLIQAAHSKGLMVFLDVVYNHFGPEGNYLRAYAPQFFSSRHRTPWGDAINFDGPASRPVRDFFIHNALYWLEEFHLDGLRLDAVHAIFDSSEPHILTELAETVRNSFGPERQIHLILENANNESRYLGSQVKASAGWYDAQWNDDIHHALHVLLTGESDGYYSDYSRDPACQLGRCLAEGFAFQGEYSPYHHAVRGESSVELTPSAFVSFLQNHDQIGNRAFGERILKFAQPARLRAAMAILSLAPSPPLLFMGEEFGAETPFLFFCDFEGDLAAAVTEGRRGEFARFAEFSSPQARARIPDPNSAATFLASKLDWDSLSRPGHAGWLEFYRCLLKLRREAIVPHLPGMPGSTANFRVCADGSLHVNWKLRDGFSLGLFANLKEDWAGDGGIPQGHWLYASHPSLEDCQRMPPWSVVWMLQS